MKVIKNGALVKATGEALWPIVAAIVLGVGGWAVINDIDGLTPGSLIAFSAVLLLAFKPLKTLIQAGMRSYASVVFNCDDCLSI